MGEGVAGVAAEEGVEPLKADLHVHTVASDGSLTFAEALDEARAEGVRCIAFTNPLRRLAEEAR